MRASGDYRRRKRGQKRDRRHRLSAVVHEIQERLAAAEDRGGQGRQYSDSHEVMAYAGHGRVADVALSLLPQPWPCLTHAFVDGDQKEGGHGLGNRKKKVKEGPDRGSNPGPLAPKARIIPLDHRAAWLRGSKYRQRE